MIQPNVAIRLSTTGAATVVDNLNSVSGATQGIDRASVAAGRSVQSMTSHLAAMGHAAAAAFGVQKLASMADGYANLNARVALASQGLGSAAVAQERLFEIANRTRTSVQGLAEVYGTLAKAGAEMGSSQARVLAITETLSKAVTLSGASADSARAAMVQFGQGLAAGTLRGDELNSVIEQTPRLAQALAEGLGKPVGELKKLAEAGQITSEAIFVALERMKGKIDKEFQDLPTTIGQSMVVLQNSLLQTIGVFDQANGVSKGFAQGIVGLAGHMDTAVVAAGVAAAAYVVLTRSTIAATVATRGLVVAQAALGGPIGWVATGLGLAASAFVAWKLAGTDSEKAVQAQVAESSADIIKRIDAQIAKLKERNALAGVPIPQGENQIALDAAKQYTDAYAKWLQVVEGSGAMAGLSGPARDDLLKVTGANMAQAFSRYSALSDQMTADATRKITESRAAYMATYATSGEKLAKELADYDKQFAGKVTESQRAADRAAIKAKSAPKAAAAPVGDPGNPFEAQQAAAKIWEKAMQDAADITAKATASTEGWTDAQRKLVEYLASPAYQTNSEAMRDLAESVLRGALAAEHDAAVHKAWAEARKKAYDEVAQATAQGVQAATSSADGVAKAVQGMKDEEAALRMSALLHITLAQAIEEVQIARLKERADAARADNNQELLDALNAEIKSRRELAGLIAGKEARKASADSAKEAADEWKKTSDSINQSLTDALFRSFESGKGFGRTLRDSLVNTFKTMVLRPIISAIVSPVSGFVTGALGFSGAAGAGGSNMGSMAGSAAGSALFSRAFGAAGASIFGSSAAYGAAIGTTNIAAGSQAAMLAAQTGQFGLYGAAATSSAAAGAGAGAASAGSAAMAAIPYVAIALVIANAMGLFRSTKQTAGGLVGTFGSGNISDAIVQREGGTLFRGPDYQTYITGISASSKLLQEAFNGLRTTTAAQAAALGLSTDNIRSFTTAIGSDVMNNDAGTRGLSLQGLTPAQAQQKIAEALQTVNEKMAEMVLGIGQTITESVVDAVSMGVDENGTEVFANVTRQVSRFMAGAGDEFRRTGETAVQTLGRLSGSLSGVNGVLGLLGAKLYATTLAGGDLASQLADLFGGLSNFKSTTGAYFEAYFSEAERAAALTGQLSQQMRALGYSLPATREGFRELVERQDLSTDAGRRSYAALVQLSGAFAELNPAAEAAATGVQNMVDALSTSGQAIFAFITELRSAAGGPAGGLAAARSSYNADLAAAQAGDADASGRIVASARTLVEAVRNSAADPLALARETSAIAVQLQTLPAVVSWQVLMLEKLSLLGLNTAAGGPLAKAVGNALGEARATITLIMDSALPDDLKALALSASAVVTRTIQTLIDSSALSASDRRLLEAVTGSAAGTLVLGGHVALVAPGLTDAITGLELATRDLNRAIDEAPGQSPKDLGEPDKPTPRVDPDPPKNRVDLGDDDSRFRWGRKSRNGEYVAEFANGGSHTGGLRIVGENGPELEATGASRIWTARQTADMVAGAGSNTATVAELQALRAELRAGQEAIAAATQAMAKQLARWDDGGAMLTKVAV